MVVDAGITPNLAANNTRSAMLAPDLETLRDDEKKMCIRHRTHMGRSHGSGKLHCVFMCPYGRADQLEPPTVPYRACRLQQQQPNTFFITLKDTFFFAAN